MAEKVKIVVATHKKYRMPEDPMYLPVHVGAEGKNIDLGYQKDNEGENISNLNPSFCELTALYWAWKNLDSEYIGLAHYRRHFTLSKKKGDSFDSVLKYDDIKGSLERIDIFVPRKQKYYIESLYSHYAHTHYSEHLDKTRAIIAEMYPEYLTSYDKIVKERSGHMFNMMIMNRQLFSDYCEWLFNILFALRDEMAGSDLSGFQGRFYGRVSEIIFNVWLNYQIESGKVQKERVKAIPVMYMEKVDWSRKIKSFLNAKFFHKKYEGSF